VPSLRYPPAERGISGLGFPMPRSAGHALWPAVNRLLFKNRPTVLGNAGTTQFSNTAITAFLSLSNVGLVRAKFARLCGSDAQQEFSGHLACDLAVDGLVERS